MSTHLSPFDRARAAGPHLRAFAQDADRLVRAARRAGRPRPVLAAAADASLPVLALLRGGAALRALCGSSLGLSRLLSTLFHVDVWSDDIGGGLRLPHPFQIVIGEGATIGEGCTLMHNVTVQRGEGTRVGPGAVLGAGAVVLSGAQIGPSTMIGANSVVRGNIAARSVAVGAPARVVRGVRAEEVQP